MEPIYVKAVTDIPDRYEALADEASATHLAYVWQSEQFYREVLATLGGRLGETPSLKLPPQLFPPLGGIPLVFPAGSEGTLTLTLPAESSLYFFTFVGGSFAEFTKTLTPPEDLAFPQAPGLKDATITFVVTDEKGNPVPGLTQDFFTFSLYPTPEDADTSDAGDVTPILEFEELAGGKYRISTLIHLEESGSLRFRVNVANPTLTSEASFYRR